MSNPPRILVAGVGNIFLGDDAFGVQVAQRLLQHPPAGNVHVGDFGIRGIDLTYALMGGYDLVILVDAVARGGEPGTIYEIEPDLPPYSAESPPVTMVDAQDLDPAKVLAMVASVGDKVGQVLLIGCEPSDAGDGMTGISGLSEPVQAAVEQAVELIRRRVAEASNMPAHPVLG